MLVADSQSKPATSQRLPAHRSRDVDPIVRHERAAQKPVGDRSHDHQKSSISQPASILVSDDDDEMSRPETDSDGDDASDGEETTLQSRLESSKTRHADISACAIARYIDEHKDNTYPTVTSLAADVLQRYQVSMLTSKGIIGRDARQTASLMLDQVKKRNRIHGYQKGHPKALTSMDFVHQGSDFLVPHLFTRKRYAMLSAQVKLTRQAPTSGTASASKEDHSRVLLSVADTPSPDDDLEDENADASKVDQPARTRSINGPDSSSRALSPEIVVTKSSEVRPATAVHTASGKSKMLSISNAVVHTVEDSPPVGELRGRKRQSSDESQPAKAQKERRAATLLGQDDTLASNRHAGSGFVRFADTDFALEEKTLNSKMHDLVTSVKSLVHEGLEDMRIDPSSPALWSLSVSPVDTLHKLYRTLLGPGMVSERRGLIADKMSAADLTTALIGAFFMLEVFEPSRLPMAADWLSSVTGAIGRLGTFVDGALSRRLNTNIDTVLRRAYLAWVNAPEFKQQELASLADHLALALAHVLHDHLQQYRNGGEIQRAADQKFVLQWAKNLEQIILRGLALRCELSCARETFRFRWHDVSAGSDPRTMEGTHGQGDTVVATVFPGLQIETEEGNRTVYKMRVRLI